MCRLALFMLFLGASSANAATISHQKLDNGSELIVISGDIQAGDQAAFKKLAIQYDKAVVGLSSNGGALVPALEIGMALHLQGFDTAVISGNQCASACALIWAGGANRYLVKGGRVGFHASYTDEGGKVVETGLGNALVGRYLTQLGFSERATIFATASHPDSIAWIANEQDAATSGFSFSFSTPAEEAKADAVAELAPPVSSVPYKTVQGWNIYRNSEDCGAAAVFKSSILEVSYNAKKHSTSVLFTYPDGTSLSEGDQRTIGIYFLKQDGTLDSGWKSLQFTAHLLDNSPILFSPNLNDPAFSDFSAAKTVGFFYNEKLISSYNLAGLSDALREVRQCSLLVNHLNSRDVFAN